MPKTIKKSLHLLKGFKDILPEHQAYWNFFYSQAEKFLANYGFGKIDVPILERTSLYVKGTGRYTDIVSKELYSFEDKAGENVTLRPEFTPGIARAYIEHGMLNKPQPVKLYSMGPVFRHDNPQSGRYRQFNQLDLEIIGSQSPVLDAQLIIICYRFLQSLGLSVMVQINSIGDPESRAEYITKFKQFLSSGGRKKKLCEDCRMRYSRNPLRILDCKREECQEIIAEAPQIVDFLDDEAKKHFMQTLEYLDDLEIEYHLNVKLVRGLDYYNRTTFEIYLREEDTSKSQGSLAGGGRYDGLIEILGGRPTPAVGVAFGIERVINKMRDLKIEVPKLDKIDVFVAQLGVEARKKCFRLYEKLTDANFRVGESFSKDDLKNQLEKANHLNARFSVILGQKELIDKTIIIRDMQSGIQEIVNYDKVVKEIRKRLDPSISSVKSYQIKNNSDNQTEKKAAPKSTEEQDSNKDQSSFEDFVASDINKPNTPSGLDSDSNLEENKPDEV